MSKNSKSSLRLDNGIIEVKSKCLSSSLAMVPTTQSTPWDIEQIFLSFGSVNFIGCGSKSPHPIRIKLFKFELCSYVMKTLGVYLNGLINKPFSSVGPCLQKYLSLEYTCNGFPQFDAEFRRFAWDRTKGSLFETFSITVCKLHHLEIIPFVITYTDVHGDLLPINNDDNFHHALDTTKTILRIIIQKKGESSGEINGYGTLNVKKRNPISKLISNDLPHKPRINISLPEDFRRVSAIIDVDIVPETHRRVKLMKNGSDKPLGFYIRDGTSVRVTPQGLEKVPGIFISRLVPGGLAESTGLLAVNDEVLEVNGIEVAGKTLDQVTDMMVANSANLIITVKPVNQRLTLAPLRGAVGRYSQISQASSASGHSRQSSKSYDSDIIVNEQDEEDEIQDHLNKSNKSSRSDGGTSKSDKVSSGSEKSNKSDEGKSSHTPDKNTKTKESPSDNTVPVTESPGMTV